MDMRSMRHSDVIFADRVRARAGRYTRLTTLTRAAAPEAGIPSPKGFRCMSSAGWNCWICGSAAADSGEHKSKKSDLKAVFGEASLLYLHDGKTRNRKRKLPSLDASRLKWANMICRYCNSTRTQHHDQAWETLHAELRKRVCSLKPEDRVRGNSVYHTADAEAMLHVHLYFAKAFGCTLVAEKAPLDIAPFAKAIMSGMPHPDFYLSFGIMAKRSIRVIQASPIIIFSSGGAIHATWFYNVDGLVIEGSVVPGAAAQKVAVQQHAWHPRLATNCFKIVGFERPPSPLQ